MFKPFSREWGFAALAVAAATAVCFVLYPFLELTNLVMVYLLATMVTAMRGNRGAAALASIGSVLAFDFFFVPPRFTFSVSDVQYLWTFAVMFATAMVISHLTIRLREKARLAEEATERNVRLFEKAKRAEVEMESERLRSSLLSTVSHDLRTPLAAILGSAGTLLAKKEFQNDPPTRDLVENIQSEGERLSRLVQNLLEVTRLESGVQLRKELYPLEETIGSALERLNKKEISVHLPKNLPPVPMDGVLIEQVFINLLENALRYTPSGQNIHLTAALEGASMVISVADQGPGLKKQELESVFEKFHRSPDSPGAGLGLAICRAIVHAHGGRIWVENRPEGGAVFRFTLPL